jgi:hypothetical protein
MRSLMTLEITYYTRSKDSSSKTVAEFGIRVVEWDITFDKMKLIRSSKGNLFVSAPSYKAQKPDGSDEYKPYWFMSEEKKRRFFDTALKTVNEYIEKNFSNQPAERSETPFEEGLF